MPTRSLSSGLPLVLCLSLCLTLVACKRDSGFVESLPDTDQDGYDTSEDCDDTDPDSNPAAVERCDGADNDCDGETDEPGALGEQSWYLDQDQDGFGVDAITQIACTPPALFASKTGDCDDDDPDFYPGAPEEDCTDPNDYNCDGSTGYADVDGDGFAACAECDDGNAAINPDATELCNTIDDDCDGRTDLEAADAPTWYADVDEDEFGDPDAPMVACEAPPGMVADATDCDDTLGTVNPIADEVCNSIDDDCDGETDEDSAVDAPRWYMDADGDGYGDTRTPLLVACEQPFRHVLDGTDCDDGRPIVNPGAVENCNGFDDDCDGITDGDANGPMERSCYSGRVGTQGVGICMAGLETCTLGAWSSCVGQVTPQVEICNAEDDDCDGTTDEEAIGIATWYPDLDGDGFGDEAATPLVQCAQPQDYVLDGTDCDDTDDLVSPSEYEVCNLIDDDCDGLTDGALPLACFTGDASRRGVGACRDGTQTCASGTYGTCAGEVLPVSELCNGVDDDCDGATDGPLPRACYDGPANTRGIGVCSDGSQDCVGGAYAECLGDVLPGTESCNALDDDCDGATDESLVRSCYTGPAGTSTRGICSPGTETCATGVWGSCLGETVPGVEACDGLDEDCDGATDESLAQACYTGPVATRSVGRCTDGLTTCSNGSWGACGGQVLPGTESCNDVDDDCDGTTDEALFQVCYTGPAATRNIGVCSDGTETCSAGAWGSCAGQVRPGAESCNDLDDDCDGSTDEGLVQVCYSGPAATRGVGACRDGNETCAAGAWGVCAGEVTPILETCNSIDDDCDGSTDEGATDATLWYADSDLDGYGDVGDPGVAACSAPAGTVDNNQDCDDVVVQVNPDGTEVCNGMDDDCDGTTDGPLPRACYSGAPATRGVGLCADGTEVCSDGSYGACAGEVLPATESCNAFDDDCDGATDESLTQVCYTGPASTRSVGQCTDGVSTCGNGSWGACSGQVLPGTESCNAVDDDCDGSTDETLVQICYTGPAATRNIGVCTDGTETCSAGAWGSCAGQVRPGAESCNDLDDDCDGSTDEGLVQVCYSGPAATRGVGACRDGNETCAAGAWGVCAGEVTPILETCNSIDDDCDGSTDEGASDATLWYADSDLDGYGDAGDPGVAACSAPAGSVGNNQDCNDGMNQVNPDGTEVCNALDDDCDGATDGPLPRACYSGALATRGVGLCADGIETCSGGSYGACAGEVLPATETCNAFDDDCDGATDESLAQACYTGPAATRTVGQCADGISTCGNGSWGACGGQVLPGTESCNALDDDCDGSTDEALFHVCYTGPAATRNIGVCSDGTETCTAGAWGSCAGEVRPGTESCNALDDDCDGDTDENLVQACYTGPAATRGVGACQDGSATCAAGAWGACAGELKPGLETCNGIDDDCDGLTDEGATDATLWYVDADLDGYGDATDPGVAACSAPAGKVANNLDCNDTTAAVSPDDGEVCNGVDDNCDGTTDGPLPQTCYTGAPATRGVGVCADGTETCSGGSYGACAGEVLPGVESCNGFDDDCDGATDESLTQACYTGPAATRGVGACQDGASVCSVGSWGACSGQILPVGETCNGTDDDCDGVTDEPGAGGCTVYRRDTDRDGVGVISDTRCLCAPSGVYDAPNSGPTDCNDGNPNAAPGLPELCATAYDDNCSGAANEAGADDCTTYYYDGDRDGYGTATSVCTCAPTGLYDTTTTGDCLDTAPAVNPGATEVCNGTDDDCDALIDQADQPVATLCPAVPNATNTCAASSGCQIVACNGSWYDIDLGYANGCEVQIDPYDLNSTGNTCLSAYDIGDLHDASPPQEGIDPYVGGDILGNILPAGDSDWYTVFASDDVPYGQDFHIDARFSSNPGDVYRFEVYDGSCGATAQGPADHFEWFTNFPYDGIAPGTPGQQNCTGTGADGVCGQPGQNCCNLSTGAFKRYYLRVFRTDGKASGAGEGYRLRVTNGIY
ncbi:MAG: putative metal-binding motif-containing protein [Deltaproteobacteria bacterium]|nr:putative metal-binding motif-containing protein [Deltaproteobacteria bacterium]